MLNSMQQEAADDLFADAGCANRFDAWYEAARAMRKARDEVKDAYLKVHESYLKASQERDNALENLGQELENGNKTRNALAEARAQIDTLLVRESTCWRMKRIAELEAELKEVMAVRDEWFNEAKDAKVALTRAGDEVATLQTELQTAWHENTMQRLGAGSTKQRHAVAQLIGFASAHGAWDRIAPAMTCATSILKEVEGEISK